MLQFQSVLCALDFSPGCTRALIAAADLAERAHAQLHLLHVAPLFNNRVTDDPLSDAEAVFARRTREFVNQALGADDAFEVLAPEIHQVHGEAPADGILRHATNLGADVIVVGTHARTGLPYLILGSVAGEVLRRADIPVLAVPERAQGIGPSPERPVLVPLDLSVDSRATLALADAFAQAYDAPIMLVHALDDPIEMPSPRAADLMPEAVGAKEDDPPHTSVHLALERLAGEIASPVRARHVTYGLPELLVEKLMEEYDIGAVVMGTHGRTGAARALLGSVAEWTVRHAACPVLTLTAAAAQTIPPLAARSASA